ncbi:MAG: HIT family protein [Candidatus Micrarchaeota archaeon]|nr:HIT family protein [Candidatus Micrarchaeota archaeon]MDE1834845.1 HIT family protein [Candidatus Micrarchaeota archaeon]MDE1859864.1 HIT family protein [Candidatus Micrarchaeota archaeon]
MQDPFCNEEAYSKTVFYESDYFRVLYDLRPVIRGHVLFVSKRHVTNLLELNNEEIGDLHKTFMKVIPAILKVYGATDESYDITSQIGPYSGRTVPHLHFHVLPRSRSDEYQNEEKNIFDDLKLNRTHFGASDVETEVKKLRKEFGYKPKTK